MCAASEVTEIRNAVSGLKAALDAMRANTDAANTNMLRLNLKEARDQLGRRLGEVCVCACVCVCVHECA